MLVLLLIEENSIANLVLKALHDSEVNALRYRDPLRVLDYIAELEPDAVIVRQKDFPLHEQLLAALIQFYKPLQRCKMIVLGKEDAPFSSCTFIKEEAFLKDPSLLLAAFSGATHVSLHGGSRLVAKAQRMVKE
ncbi:MAG: hypothetical protein ABFC92_05175 [Rectinema sp.]|jgi:hypothetical protein|uniref:Response regulatory domain-containing protein n=1 Tax=uncultured spirochete TaxID=156406 RepID=A0A3P3XUX3_9SPIR|nr:hypothetical protein SPIRO4BDMA_70185 [uncultured spirochete]